MLQHAGQVVGSAGTAQAPHVIGFAVLGNRALVLRLYGIGHAHPVLAVAGNPAVVAVLGADLKLQVVVVGIEPVVQACDARYGAAGREHRVSGIRAVRVALDTEVHGIDLVVLRQILRDIGAIGQTVVNTGNVHVARGAEPAQAILGRIPQRRVAQALPPRIVLVPGLLIHGHRGFNRTEGAVGIFSVQRPPKTL